MELEFDNEIDALLRKEAGARTITVSEVALLHLDADEIAAFAENAVPALARQQYAAHFADCEPCRQTLSSVILLNSATEAGSVQAVAAPVGAESVVPWYRRLFLFPNLAYLMGSLVLLFSGFLAISLLKNAGESQIADVSQVRSDEPAAAAPNLDYAANYYNSNASAANSSTTAANTMANVANRGEDAALANKSVAPVSPLPEATADAKPQNPSIAADGVSGRQAAPPTAPQQSPVERPAALADKNDVALAEEKRNVREQEVSKEKDELKSRSETALLNPGGPSKLMKGPARKAATPESAMTSGRRMVSGRSFELKQGVWYDSTYRGQGTTNIRRGTEQYKKIGGGLRAIGEGISGTVVTVWNGKAYRID